MSRISAVFKKGPAYVGYLTAGDGGHEKSLAAMLALIKGGVNILEVGVPFSDPIADGPIIQQASQRALLQGFSLDKVLKLIAELRTQTTIPIILFSYYNPIYRNAAHFYSTAKKAGVDGMLVVDLPLEEAQPHVAYCKQYHLDPIFLIPPSTPSDRLQRINQFAAGMLYYVCRHGTTGIKTSLPDHFSEKLAEIKAVTSLPVVTGFGISNRDMARQALQHADGFVVGSLFVEAAHQGRDLTALAHWLRYSFSDKYFGENDRAIRSQPSPSLSRKRERKARK